MTEPWFRNPDNYIRELVETGECLVAWDRGLLVKRKMDPIKHAELYFGQTYPWRVLAVGEQGTAEYRDGDEIYKPTAVYPTWRYGEDQSLLEEIIEQPVGEDRSICDDMSVAGDERPVFGQEHRVVVTDLPAMNSGPGRKFVVYLKTLQEDFPDCIIHLHGVYSFRVAFGMGFGAADIEPRTAAQKGKLMVPSGREERFERAQANPQWCVPLGFKPVDLAIPRNRCMYNIRSAVWAAENYQNLYNVPLRNTGVLIDSQSSDNDHKPIEAGRILSTLAIPKAGDKFHCDTCSLSDQCKYFRDGAVCSVPGAEPKELATFFKTRDADTIIDGLGILVAAGARRLERGMDEERVIGDISSEVTKMLGQVFDQGAKLAKLLDPNLRGGTRVQVNVGAGGQAAVVANANPKQLVASVIRELEGRGIRREDITPDMVEGLIAGMLNPEQARRGIEAHRVITQDGQDVA